MYGYLFVLIIGIFIGILLGIFGTCTLISHRKKTKKKHGFDKVFYEKINADKDLLDKGRTDYSSEEFL